MLPAVISGTLLSQAPAIPEILRAPGLFMYEQHLQPSLAHRLPPLQCFSCNRWSLCRPHVRDIRQENPAQMPGLLSKVCGIRDVTQHLLCVELGSINLAPVLFEEAGSYQQKANGAFEEPTTAHPDTCEYRRCAIKIAHQGRCAAWKQSTSCQKRCCVFGRFFRWWWVCDVRKKPIGLSTRGRAANWKQCASHRFLIQIRRGHFGLPVWHRNRTAINSMASFWPGSSQSGCRTAQALPGEKGAAWYCIALAW